MHASHFIAKPRAGSSDMSSERLRAMKASAMRALVGKSTASSSSPASASSSSSPKTTCLCAPTTHPGSFRCRMHRNSPSSSTAARPRGAAPPAAAVRSPPAMAPPPQQQQQLQHRTCSRCLVRGRSRLSRVGYATGKEEMAEVEAPETMTLPNPLPVVRLAVHRDRMSSAAIGARFCALRRLQGSGKDDFMRSIRPTSPRIILLSN